MMRILVVVLLFGVVAGCVVFKQSPEPGQSSKMKSESVTKDELRSLQSGEWYRVRLHNSQEGSTRTRCEYVGHLQRSDEDTITLTDASRRIRYESTSLLRQMPIYGRLYKNSGVSNQVEPSPTSLARSQIREIERISATQAAEMKQPFERIGVDFDFNVKEGSRPDPFIRIAPAHASEL